jgi:hypothetical protein
MVSGGAGYAIGRFETQAGTGNSTMHRLASALREIRKSTG